MPPTQHSCAKDWVDSRSELWQDPFPAWPSVVKRAGGVVKEGLRPRSKETLATRITGAEKGWLLSEWGGEGTL